MDPSVGGSAVFDANHDDFLSVLAQSVEHLIAVATRGPDPGQISPQRLAYTWRLSHQGGREEVDHSSGDRIG
jgi:hypothetical protein